MSVLYNSKETNERSSLQRLDCTYHFHHLICIHTSLSSLLVGEKSPMFSIDARRIFAILFFSSMVVANVMAFQVSHALLQRTTSRMLAKPRAFSSLISRLWETIPEKGPLPTNQELVERRLAANRAKRESRERMVQERVDRNLRLKRLLHSNSTDYPVPPLYAVKIWVDEELREEMRLSGREKRGRVFIEAGTDGVSTIKGLRRELFAFFTALKKNTFLLSASYPSITSDGKIEATFPEESWPIETDEDVASTFQNADNFFQESSSSQQLLQRPSIQINVLKDPNAPPPLPPPVYLENMNDPNESKSMTMLSFYAFPPSGIQDPESFAYDIKKKWKPFQALGRVYVANEGVNAQMSVPTNVLKNFMQCCKSIPELGEYMENGINIDPKPLSVEEFQVAGVPINGKPAPPFRNLHVRVRSQVVADGLDKSLDWQSAGYDMPPLEWHEKLKEAKEGRTSAGKQEPIILDCRNTYETDVGIFEGAEPLGTENFRDSWDVLKDRLADAPKDAPIMTYCTGGIRCVKVGAYLTQELGFTNVSRLAGGIIAYDRTLTEKQEGEDSMFKGTNFVFDGRLGRKITEDALASCITCGAETSLVSNCRNDNCHKRIVQCETCRTSFQGTCSNACKTRLVNGAMTPRRLNNNDVNVSEGSTFETLDDYSIGHSTQAPSIYGEIEHNTRIFLPSGAHMVSGASQGRLLSQLTSMTREGRILELGTFTGYATLCFLEGARNVGQVTKVVDGGIQSGPYVMSMERDSRAFNIAGSHIQAVANSGLGEEGAEAISSLRTKEIPEIESNLVSFSLEGIAGCDLVKVTDALATVEDIANGTGDLKPAPFDMVFVDADKTRLLDYVEACLSSDLLLKPGGLIVVDNVLWKGLVLEASSGVFSSAADTPTSEKDELRKNRRARKLATQMHRFNSAIVGDDRVEVVMLPMRDGLSVIRKL